jgi:hypothetical protein
VKPRSISILVREMGRRSALVLGVAVLAVCPALAQQKPIAFAPTNGVTIAGSLEVTNNRASIGPNATITAGDKTAHITLARGGSLDVCRSTKIQLSADKSLGPAARPGDNAIMISLDQGAFEAHDTPGKYSDVVMTPDLRILISGPGKAEMSFRVARNGDTCIDNRGKNAPYVTVTGLFSGGVYRVQANQRVLIEHGDLGQVVDNEPEPCGCPPPPKDIAKAGFGMGHGNTKENKAARENPFPLAESEGLKPPPPEPTEPVAPAGQIQTQVAVPITYNGSTPRSSVLHLQAVQPTEKAGKTAEATAAVPEVKKAAQKHVAKFRKQRPGKKHHRGFFGAIGHFFARMFGHK